MPPPAVLTWPREAAAVQAALQDGPTVVLCIAQPPGTDRPAARARVRQALQEALGAWLACPADSVMLQGGTGTPVRLVNPTCHAGLSISHEEGLSLAAIAPGASVGVDLLATGTLPEAAECLQLARDYLGPGTAKALGELPAVDIPAAFGRAWTAWEAGLKCAGQALQEWNHVDHKALAHHGLTSLLQLEGYTGTLFVGSNTPHATTVPAR